MNFATCMVEGTKKIKTISWINKKQQHMVKKLQR